MTIYKHGDLKKRLFQYIINKWHDLLAREFLFSESDTLADGRAEDGLSNGLSPARAPVPPDY